MIATHIADPCGRDQTDRFVIVQIQGQIYQFTESAWVKKAKEIRLHPVQTSSVEEKSSISSLPTKSVTVTSSKGTSFVRRQHVRLGDDVTQGRNHVKELKGLIAEGHVTDENAHGVGAWIKDLPEVKHFIEAKESMNSFAALIKRSPNRHSIIDSLDLDHKIAGVSIRGYLADAFGSGHELQRHLLKDNFSVNKESTNLDKAAALYKTALDVKNKPRDEQEEFINSSLSEFVDANFLAYSFKKYVDKRAENIGNEQNVRKDFLTVLDHSLTRTTSTNLAGFYKKIHDSVLTNKEWNGLQNEVPRLIGSSINPKKMDAFLTESRIKKPDLDDSETASKVLGGWIQGTFNGMGLLIRRAGQSLAGIDLPDRAHINSIEDTHYPLDKISEDKVPASVARSVKQLHKFTQEFVRTNKNELFKEGVYRGVEFSQGARTSVLRPSISSTSLSYNSAASFSKNASGRALAMFGHKRFGKEHTGELYDTHGVLLSNSSKPYINNVRHVGSGTNKQFVIEYDHNKLIKDRKILFALTEESMEFYKKNGVKIPKNFEGYKWEKELVIAI